MSATLAATMSLAASPAATSSRSHWIGRVLSGIAVLFLVFDLGFKLLASPEALAKGPDLGWQPHQMPLVGLIELACLVVYLVPRTALLGAVLWTGYLGGAIATHVRVESPLFSHTLFPVYVAALIWGGLYLRDARVRAAIGPVR